ncbi:unnamed protein product [Fusarium equiseti]|uniref:Uncharacterized protein n=1 Tax=Fusarium equiseti TaxID=61235 RepID=A0A8J2IEP3_FUSEQ|nr:unnamed protein product [Fusarium equiseti]
MQEVRQAIRAIPEDSPDPASYLARLAKQLHRKHFITGSIVYLDEGIRILQAAADIVPEEHHSRGRIIHNLSSQLHDRYVRQKSMTDLNKATLIARDSIDALSEDDPTLALFFENLGNLLMESYNGKGVKWDLDEAIDCTRQALSTVGNDDQSRASLLDRLGYLEEAIANLGTLLEHKYHSTKTKDQEELRECIKYHVATVHAEQSPTLRQIRTADDVLSYCADVPDWDLAYQVSTSAIALFPKLIFRSHQHSDKLHMLGQVSGLASEAAAVALNADKDLGAVLTILEEGREFSPSMDEMRTDRGSLQAQHLQYRYTDAQDDPDETWQAESQRQKEADERLDELLSKIRKEPGFEDYLLPPSEADMKAATEKGLIAVINIEPPTPFQKVDSVSDSNFDVWDAVICRNEWDIPSKKNRGGLSKKPANALGSSKVLGWLWETIVEPVLNFMGYKGAPEDGIWPHVWWIPTGSLSRFPIRAAGDNYPGTRETVLDRTISSYNSSIKSVI